MSEGELQHKLKELSDAIGRKDHRATKVFLRELRQILKLSPEEFAQMIHVTGRTVRRWEAETPEADLGFSAATSKTWNLPSIAKVARWNLNIEPKASPVNRDVPVKMVRGREPGVFPLEKILERMSQASAIWALKCRMRFHAAVSADCQRVLLDGFRRQNEKLTLHCVWIDPDTLQDGKNLNEVRPAAVAQESFDDLIAFAEGKVEDVDQRILGHRLPFLEAAKIGLANGPCSLLVIVYNSEGVSTYNAKLDLFLELTSACYTDATLTSAISHEEINVWVQIHPPAASCYWSQVWNEFKGIQKEEFQYHKR